MKRLARDLGSLDKPHPSRDHQTKPPNLAFGGQVIREGCQNAGRQFLRSVTCDLRSQVHDGRITVTVAQIITIGGYIDPWGDINRGTDFNLPEAGNIPRQNSISDCRPNR